MIDMKPGEFLTGEDVARAIKKCNDGNYYSGLRGGTVRLDGWFDLDRSARLLSRLARARARRSMGRIVAREAIAGSFDQIEAKPGGITWIED